MKTARRATLSLVLPLSLLVSASACAENLQASGPARDAAAQAPQKPESRADSLPDGITDIILTETSLETLLREYPSVRPDIDTPEMSEEDRKATRYYYKTLKDAASGSDLLFISMVGPYFCGTEGCSFHIFRNDDGKGYAFAKGFTVPGPVIHALKEKNTLSLVVDASDGGQGLWTWGGDKKYHYSGPYVGAPAPGKPAP